MQRDERWGITVEGLGPGLNSATHKLEKEISKSGPAIGETVKKIVGNSSNNNPAQEASTDRK
jgi:hypothetical protein